MTPYIIIVIIRLDCADGTIITGEFGFTLPIDVPQTSTYENPYYEGEPNGLVEVHFADGGFYKGYIIFHIIRIIAFLHYYSLGTIIVIITHHSL